jgi:hypothetical protein
MITILVSIINIIGGEGQAWPRRPFKKHKNLHFDNEQDVYRSSKTSDDSGYGLNLDLLTILY